MLFSGQSTRKEKDKEKSFSILSLRGTTDSN